MIKRFLLCILLPLIIFSVDHSPVYARMGETRIEGSGLKDDALLDAVLCGDEKKVADLVKKGAFVGKKFDGMPLLMYAIREKRTEIAKFLILKGADINARDNCNETVLMYAAKKGNKEVVKALLAKGAIVNVKDSSGKIALMYALDGSSRQPIRGLSADYMEIIKILLSKCNDINYRDRNSETFLMCAVSAVNLEAVNLLISKGINVNARNRSNETALEIAERFSESLEKIDLNRAIDPQHIEQLRADMKEIIALLKKAGGYKW